MPHCSARCLTAFNRLAGSRMLSCEALGSNSNWTAFPPERSYRVRSELATKRSACASVLNVGIFLFIVLDLLCMHVACTDGANNRLATTRPHREHDKDVPPIFVACNGAQSFFGLRMIFVR